MSVSGKMFHKILVLVTVTALFVFTAAPVFANTSQANARGDSSVKVQKFHRNVLHIKLAHGVTTRGGYFSGAPADQVNTLNVLLSQSNSINIRKLVDVTGQSRAHKKLVENLNGYYKVTFKQDIDMPALTSKLKKLSIVETAYAAPTPAPAPAKPQVNANYVAMQNYRQSTPQGVDSTYAANFPGGTGQNTKIVDIEYSWNTNHQDLTKAKVALVPNGTPVDPFNNNNHGTAVLGEMIADSNTIGVTGVSPASELLLINAFNAERGYDLVGALQLAALNTVPGDVIIIEQQSWGPTADQNDFVPVEWIPEVYDAVRALTASGIVVVEPAGNGSQNLDNAAIYGTSFPMGKQDSGAIIVGAAHNCSGTNRLSRMAYSTYGSRVNMQGPGECVVTTGYGDLASATGANGYYTSSFSGTSSAAPVVAAAAASLNSAHETLNGVSISPDQLRAVLMTTATAQITSGTGVLAGNIGGYPNLAKALLSTDKQGPLAPTNVKATVVSKRSMAVSLSWAASTDNVKVMKYYVYRNGALYATVSGTTISYSDTQVVKGQSYTYQLRAADGSNNVSAFSSSITVTL
jgi:serine protease